MDSDTAVRPCSVQLAELQTVPWCAVRHGAEPWCTPRTASQLWATRPSGPVATPLQHCSSPGPVSSALVSLSCSVVLLQLNFSLLSDCLNFQFRIASSITVRNQPFHFILKRLVLFVFCPARESESI